MLPSYEPLNQTSPIFKISFGRAAVTIACLPFMSFIFCVLWSLANYFESSTATHCNVRNYLPSISAAIGNYQPQRIIWQIAISLHLIPRLFLALWYYDYYSTVTKKGYNCVTYIACILNIIENFALLGLSLWTSSDNYPTHKTCFITFIISSEIYMLTTLILNKIGRKYPQLSKQQRYSFKWKRNLFILNVVCILLTVYFFNRHNSYCETGVYTLFAFFEYLVVLSNMGFHMTAFWDFYDQNLLFNWQKGFYISRIR